MNMTEEIQEEGSILNEWLSENADVTGFQRVSEAVSARQSLEGIRRTSNIVQALENLIIQCKNSSEFAPVLDYAQEALLQAQLQLREKIHLIR